MPRGHGRPGSGMFDALGEPPYEACAFFVSTSRSASQQVGKAGVPGLLFTSSSVLVPSLFPLLFLSTSAAISLFLNPCLLALDSSILLCSLHLGLVDQRQVWIDLRQVTFEHKPLGGEGVRHEIIEGKNILSRGASHAKTLR